MIINNTSELRLRKQNIRGHSRTIANFSFSFEFSANNSEYPELFLWAIFLLIQ